MKTIQTLLRSISFAALALVTLVVCGVGLAADVPDAPANLQAIATNPSNIALSWGDTFGETGYRIEWSGDGVNWHLYTNFGADNTSINHNHLDCQTTRYHRVFAFNDAGMSAPSNVTSTTTFDCPTREFIKNRDFETNGDAYPKLPDGWVKKGTLKGDRVVALTDDSDSNFYAFRFTGKPGESSRIQQKVNAANLVFSATDVATLSARIEQQSGQPGSLVAQAIIQYKSGATQKLQLYLAETPEAGFAEFLNEQPLQATDVKRIVIQLRYNAPGGKFLIDNVSLTIDTPEN